MADHGIGGVGSLVSDAADEPTTTEADGSTTTATTDAETPSTTEEETSPTTPTEAERISAIPRGRFSGSSEVLECVGWDAGDSCAGFIVTDLPIECIGTCTATFLDADVRLTFADGAYTGEVRDVDLGTTCQGAPTRATITLRITVGEAMYTFEQWRAETISGQARITQQNDGTACGEATVLLAFDLREGPS